jgi:hypothetical protein
MNSSSTRATSAGVNQSAASSSSLPKSALKTVALANHVEMQGRPSRKHPKSGPRTASGARYGDHGGAKTRGEAGQHVGGVDKGG